MRDPTGPTEDSEVRRFAASGTSLIACSASAVIVRLGLTPTFAGTAEPSQTSRFS